MALLALFAASALFAFFPFACVRTQQPVEEPVSARAWVKPPEAELRARLSPIAFEVTQHAATEPPFDNAYWDEHRKGIYLDVVSGEPLFASVDKFDSGTGWPSFTRPIREAAVRNSVDRAFGIERVEVRSAVAGSHLGHVFDDGPPPTGKRYCINSAALRFVPAEQLEAEGLTAYAAYVETGKGAPDQLAVACPIRRPGELAAAASAGVMAAGQGQHLGCASSFEVTVLAGGCFWGMEELLRAIPGVVETEVGYAGGTTKAPTYEDVHSGATGHAEAVKVTFDPKRLSFAELLERWYFRMHNPTTVDQQGNDVGSQYRSVIFFTSPEQQRVAEAIRSKVDRSGVWKAPVVTQVVAATTFTRAEDYHQDYLQKNPSGYTCHFLRPLDFSAASSSATSAP